MLTCIWSYPLRIIKYAEKRLADLPLLLGSKSKRCL